MKVKVVGRARSATLALRWFYSVFFYPLGFITLGFTSLVSTPSAFINKTGTVLFPLAFNCLSVCLSVCLDGCSHFILKVSHFVCVQGTIWLAIVNKNARYTFRWRITSFRWQEISLRLQEISLLLTRYTFGWQSASFAAAEREREARPTLVYAVSMRTTFCESGGGKSAKRDLGVAVVLPRGFTPLVLSPLGLPVLFPRRRHLLITGTWARNWSCLHRFLFLPIFW